MYNWDLLYTAYKELIIFYCTCYKTATDRLATWSLKHEKTDHKLIPHLWNPFRKQLIIIWTTRRVLGSSKQYNVRDYSAM